MEDEPADRFLWTSFENDDKNCWEAAMRENGKFLPPFLTHWFILMSSV